MGGGPGEGAGAVAVIGVAGGDGGLGEETRVRGGLKDQVRQRRVHNNIQ